MNRLFIILSILFIQSCIGQPDRWAVVTNEQGVFIMEGADSVLFYQRAPTSRPP